MPCKNPNCYDGKVPVNQGEGLAPCRDCNGKPILPRDHCQNGVADICLAGAADGICCAEHECDIDDGVRPDPRPQETYHANP